MHLRQEIVTFLDLLERWAVIPASWKIFPQPFKAFEGFLYGAWITLDSLGQFHLAFPDSERRIGGEDVGAMEIEKMVILDDGLCILLFLEERLSSLDDDVGVVVLFDRVAQKNLLVSAAQGLLCSILSLGCAGTWNDVPMKSVWAVA